MFGGVLEFVWCEFWQLCMMIDVECCFECVVCGWCVVYCVDCLCDDWNVCEMVECIGI